MKIGKDPKISNLVDELKTIILDKQDKAQNFPEGLYPILELNLNWFFVKFLNLSLLKASIESYV